MTYIKTNWQTGDTITANKLNNIENGIESLSTSSGILVVHVNNETLDKTWQEIYDAMKTGSIAYITYEESSTSVAAHYVVAAYSNESHGLYNVDVLTGPNSMDSYLTTAANNYPTLSGGVQ